MTSHVTNIIKFAPPIVQQNWKTFVRSGKIIHTFPDKFNLNTSASVLSAIALVSDEVKSESMELISWLFKAYKVNVDASDKIDDDLKVFMHRHAIFFVLATLMCANGFELKLSIFDYIKSDLSNSNQTVIANFLYAFRCDIELIYSISAQQYKICKDIMLIFTSLGDMVQDDCNENLQDQLHIIRPSPSYLPDIMLNRLLILSYFPDDTRIMYHLQQAVSPRLYLLQTKRANKQLTASEALELYKYFPVNVNEQYMSLIQEFKDKIYRTHLVQSGKLKLCVPDYKHPPVYIEFHDRQILWQIFIFCTPNWERLWFDLQLPGTYEVQKRLRFCKEIEKWEPNPVALIDIFLSYF